jgi:predicted RNA-binding Zn-ribbon protein involved in translation (DUF1610 family)
MSGKIIKFPEPAPERRACAACGWELPIKMMFGIVLPKAQLTMSLGEKFEIKQTFSWECPGCGAPFEVTRTLSEEDVSKKT